MKTFKEFTSDILEQISPKEANAENCSDLPSDEKKKERQLDVKKMREKK